MKDEKIKFCPLLTGQEEVKALMIGQGDCVIPVLRVCMQENCVAYDGGKKWCNHYNSPVECWVEKERDEHEKRKLFCRSWLDEKQT